MWSWSAPDSADWKTVHRLAGAPVRITMVDRRNHHLFQPLLYQVATASLAPSEIAWPIRTLLRKRPEVATLLASVEAIDKEARRVRLDDGSTLRYDTLVLATGARHAYFGHDDWEPLAPSFLASVRAFFRTRSIEATASSARGWENGSTALGDLGSAENGDDPGGNPVPLRKTAGGGALEHPHRLSAAHEVAPPGSSRRPRRR